jgi:hypothetical protein
MEDDLIVGLDHIKGTAVLYEQTPNRFRDRASVAKMSLELRKQDHLLVDMTYDRRGDGGRPGIQLLPETKLGRGLHYLTSASLS